jgi:hypothetical protein
VFKKSTLKKYLNLAFNGSKYPGDILETLFTKEFGEGYLMESEPEKGKMPHVFVTSVDTGVKTNQAKSVCISNYSLEENNEEYSRIEKKDSWKKKEALLATTYFKEFKKNGVTYIDGGFKNMNPVVMAIKEAKLIWKDREISCIVSLGTGSPKEEKIKTDNISVFVKNIIDQSMSSSALINQAKYLIKGSPTKLYHLSPEDLGSDDLDTIHKHLEWKLRVLEYVKGLNKGDAIFWETLKTLLEN